MKLDMWSADLCFRKTGGYTGISYDYLTNP